MNIICFVMSILPHTTSIVESTTERSTWNYNSPKC